MTRPPFKKRLAKHPAVHVVVCFLAACYVRLVLLTSRVERHIDAQTKELFAAGKPAILAFWHGRLLIMYGVMPSSRPTHMLISMHNDGQLIARVARLLGSQVIHGSSSRGGTAAMRQILTKLKSGDYVAITPDGPRGPFQQASLGMVQAGILAQVPIIAIGYSAAKHKRFRSWDKFMLPMLCNRIVYVVSAPLYPPQQRDDAATEEFHLRTQQALIDVTNQADRLAGVEVTL
jgi:lysophospholipid acyltransferase (LPLAT)-like uncharacterized protein